MVVRNINRIMTRLRSLVYKLWCVWDKTQFDGGRYSNSIDIVIPCIKKDLMILPYCIEGIKRNVLNPIKNIYLVTPKDESFIQFAENHGLRWVNENEVLGYSVNDIHFVTKDGNNRSGWIFQQLLKLSGNVGTERFYLVVDADHILIRPHLFVTNNNKCVFYMSKEYHIQYYINIKHILGFWPKSVLSYIAHKMIFDKEVICQLKKQISNGDKTWDMSIIDSLDDKNGAPFSEYETYGNYYPKTNKILKPWKEKSLSFDRLESVPILEAKYGEKYNSITYPDYLN